MTKLAGKIVLLVKLAGRWSNERYAAKDARGKAGWTSVRIDKATAAKLHEMARTLPKLAEPGAHYVTPYSVAELVDLLANAQPVPIDKTHACPDPRVHAHAGKLVDEMKRKVAAEVFENPLYTAEERRVLADFWEWLVPDILSLRVALQGVHASGDRRRPKVHAPRVPSAEGHSAFCTLPDGHEGPCPRVVDLAQMDIVDALKVNDV